MSCPIETWRTSPLCAHPMLADVPIGACGCVFFHYICSDYCVVSCASNTTVFLFFQSAYSHRYSPPKILEDLVKPHSRKWHAGVSLNYHQHVWHFWLLHFFYLVFTGWCSAVGCLAGSRREQPQWDQMCLPPVDNQTKRFLPSFEPLFFSTAFSIPLSSCPPAAASSGQEFMLFVHPSHTCMLLCNGWMEVLGDGWGHSLWYQRGQAPAQLDVRKANARLAQGIGETFYLFRPVRISFRIIYFGICPVSGGEETCSDAAQKHFTNNWSSLCSPAAAQLLHGHCVTLSGVSKGGCTAEWGFWMHI